MKKRGLGLTAASSSSRMFTELGLCLERADEFRVHKRGNQTVGYMMGATRSSSLSSIVDKETFCYANNVPLDKDETWSYPPRDIQVYYRTKKDLRSAPATLLSFRLDEDHM